MDYTSAVRLSGGHRLQVQMIRDEASPATGEQRFNLTLIAPNPMFISPPVRVQRSRAQLSAGGQRADLALMVEFPDGLRRALVSTRLYVDGILVSESAEPAPAAVTWPLEGYTTSQRHAVRVEVEALEVTLRTIPIADAVRQHFAVPKLPAPPVTVSVPPLPSLTV